MENIRLKLGYKMMPDTAGTEYLVNIIYQDEDLRATDDVDSDDDVLVLFRSKKWKIQSRFCPEVSERENILWLRGTDNDRDDETTEVSSRALKELAHVVAAFNGRKNVCQVKDAGVLL